MNVWLLSKHCMKTDKLIYNNNEEVIDHTQNLQSEENFKISAKIECEVEPSVDLTLLAKYVQTHT